jgi:hypothetical protein
MTDRTGGIWDELPPPPDESPGDLVPPIDLWMEGEIGSESLSDEDRREARLLLAGEGSCVQQPLGLPSTRGED